MNRKTVAIILMIVGGAIFLGILLFVLDRATSTEPDGLGTWIFAILGFLLSAATGIKGWRDFNKKETPTSTTTIMAGAESKVATGSNSRIVDMHNGAYIERADKVVIQTEKTSLSPLHQLPQPPADFTGREELITQLIDDFHSHKGAAITGKSLHGLIGMGGVGKTALGLVVAHQLSEEYPDAQIFLDLKGTTEPLSAADIMRHVILSFEPKIDMRSLEETSLQAAYFSVLHGKRVLLFFDNARSEDQIAPVRPPDTCALLVTSRWTFHVAGLKTHPLDVLDPVDAKKFLLDLSQRFGEYADELAKACAYLPLALRIAGSFLKVNKNRQVDKYIGLLTDNTKRLAALKQSRVDANIKTEPDLLAVFELSYQQLPADDQKRWRALCVFPASFGEAAAGAMWELEEDQTLGQLGILLSYSLLDYDETASRYSLHDLLAEYGRSQMSDKEESDAHLNHALHYKQVLAAADNLFLQGGDNILAGLRLFDLERDNIQSAQEWATMQENNPSAAELCVAYPEAGAYILNLRLHPREWIQWLDVSVSAAREIGDRRGEGIALNNLGIGYKNLGNINKAIEYYELTLIIKRETRDRRGEGLALNNLGTAYASLGQANKAIEYYEQALVIARETGDRRSEGLALGSLGNAYGDLGDVNKAIEFYEQHLVIAREVGDRRSEGTTLCNLGIAYTILGQANKAIEYYERALVIAREVGDRRGEGNALFNMGLALYDLEEKDRAIDLVKQALAIREAIESPLVEKTRNQLKQWGALPADPPT